MKPVRQAMRGFTLIEILVALFILAVAFAGVVNQIGHTTLVLASLRDRTYAEWVAENVVADIRLRPTFPDTGRSDGEEMLGGANWFWQATINATQENDLRRIDVQVSDKKNGGSIVTLTGFVSKPMPRPVAGSAPNGNAPGNDGDASTPDSTPADDGSSSSTDPTPADDGGKGGG